MKMLHVLLIVTSLALSSGCASVISPESLRKPQDTTPITLTKEFIYPLSQGSKNRVGLVAGSYAPEFEDEEGTYYRGPAGCVINQINLKSSTEPLHEDGGLWIAKGSDHPKARLYHYLGTAAHRPLDTNAAVAQAMIAVPSATPMQAGAGAGLATGLVQGIIESERGKIAFFPYITENIDLGSYLLAK